MRRWSAPTRNRVAAAVAAAVATCSAVACLPPPTPPAKAPPSAAGTCRPDPFTSDAARFLNTWGAGHSLTVAVFDDRTGCWYHLNRERRVTTASVVKAEIMAGALLSAQNAGRSLSVRERNLVSPMIRESANAPASTLWVRLGGAAGMDRIGRTFGLEATNETSPTWGLTTTTAEDQARFIHRLVQGDGPLNEASRGEAWRFLQDIRPDQRWGVRSGVPATWAVGHKNGFAPSRCCGWRANSVGYVADPAGGGYAIAIFTDGWPNLARGIPLVDAAAATVATTLTAT